MQFVKPKGTKCVKHENLHGYNMYPILLQMCVRMITIGALQINNMIYYACSIFITQSCLINAEDDSQSRTEAAVEPHHLQPNPSYCSIEMMKKTQHIAYENVVMQM